MMLASLVAVLGKSHWYKVEKANGQELSLVEPHFNLTQAGVWDHIMIYCIIYKYSLKSLTEIWIYQQMKFANNP